MANRTSVCLDLAKHNHLWLATHIHDIMPFFGYCLIMNKFLILCSLQYNKIGVLQKFGILSVNRNGRYCVCKSLQCSSYRTISVSTLTSWHTSNMSSVAGLPWLSRNLLKSTPALLSIVSPKLLSSKFV